MKKFIHLKDEEGPDGRFIPIDTIGGIREHGSGSVAILSRDGHRIGIAQWSEVKSLVYGNDVIVAQAGWRVVTLDGQSLCYTPIIAWRVGNWGVTPATPDGRLNQALVEGGCSALALPPEGDAYDITLFEDDSRIAPSKEEMAAYLRASEERRIYTREAMGYREAERRPQDKAAARRGNGWHGPQQYRRAQVVDDEPPF